MTEWALSMFERRLVINNGSRTLCHPMQSVIIQVIYKIGGPQSVSPICHSQVWLQTESDDSKSYWLNHNSYNFWKQQIHSDKYVLERQCLSRKFLNFWKFHNFPRISGCCYGYCDQFCDWLIWLKGLSMVGCFNCQIAGVWLQPIIRLQLYRIFSEE